MFKHFNMNPRGAFLLNEPVRPHDTKAVRISFGLNPLTPNDRCSGRTAPLTSKR